MNQQFDLNDPIHGNLWAEFHQPCLAEISPYFVDEASNNALFPFDYLSEPSGPSQLPPDQGVDLERMEAVQQFSLTQGVDSSLGGLHPRAEAFHPSGTAGPMATTQMPRVDPQIVGSPR